MPAGHPTAPVADDDRAGEAPGVGDRPAAERGVPAGSPPVAAPGPGGPDSPPRRRIRPAPSGTVARAVAAAPAGVALALAFPPYGWWPLSVLAVAALSLLVRGTGARRGALIGFCFGLPFFVVLLKWLHVIGWDVTLGLAFLQALFPMALGAGLAATSRLPLWPLWTACLWVAQEWARDRIPLGGFPWGRLAFANTSTPFTPLAALGGAPLVTFAVALTGALLALVVLRLATALRRRGQKPAPTPSRGVLRAVPPLAGAGLALLAAGGTVVAGRAVPVPTEPAETVRIAVVQGNVQQPGMDFLGRPMLILNNHVDATLDLARDVREGRVERPDLVIWPENASDLDPHRHPQARAAIDRAARSIGVPILVGALVDHPTETGYVENQGIVWDPVTGPGDSYTKQHPVPFGEYVPFRAQLSKVITRLERVPRDFWPGEETGVLDVGPARLGDVICFEVAYDGIVRDTVNAGARALVIQTNNATYGHTGQPEQQLAMSELRAVEHGRAIVTAATSGISAIVAPDGTIVQRTEEFTREVLVGELPLRDERTVADRVGAAPEWGLALLGLAAWGGVLLRDRRAARTGTAADPRGPATSRDERPGDLPA
ncbi:apolipoprotein N-acyltransferase [Streptomyces calidiresistens]|uniref:Apolipoprotein N-acyltransferase n=1 Tax=Streptomyces calidiresistens TaxID=1485586 RepID=A0A7W3T1Q2_9ACTN|nr:apolipoprotein N-acyltransferase [Streptomyces calidiresistens]MBB0229246.1 apolipoprotein N-acyltransferase [Streptomyces calidiresistens]